jgi:hypothetical protein
MTSSWQVEVSLSTADCASSWSCMRPSYSSGVLFEVTMVSLWRCRATVSS